MTDLHPKANSEYINHLNKVRVLNLIREENEISRSEIVKRTGLSAPTVTRIVDSLLKVEQLAEQVGVGESSGGRPPLIVRFSGEHRYVVGLDWGHTHIYGRLSDLNGEAIVELDIKTDASESFENNLMRVINLIKKLIKKSNINEKSLNGIGVAVAGYVNKNNNNIEYSPNFNWKNVDILTPLKDVFRVPVIVDNVSRVMAQGELMYGIGSSCKDFIFINIGYGIGSGIIIRGEAFFGFDGISGEIGHNRIVSAHKNNRMCTCGKTNCLECYSSGRGIAETARLLAKQDKTSTINKLANINAKTIASEAINGDKLAISIFKDAAEHLGIAIASMANNFNPAAIVLGGKVIGNKDFFYDHIREVFEREVLQQTNRKIKLLRSELAGEAAIKGAISLILKEVLNLRVEN